MSKKYGAPIVFSCSAPDDLLDDDWEELCDQSTLDILDNQMGIPCGGNGMPGVWCLHCHWGNWDYVANVNAELLGNAVNRCGRHIQ